MTDFEKEEIESYSKEIYYYGINASNKKIKAPSFIQIDEFCENKNLVQTKIAKKCYDDKSGNYKAIKGDHISYRYEILSLLGTGSFGNVLKVYDHKQK